MTQEDNGPDLTLLAMAAYDAIRKSMEEGNWKEWKGAAAAGQAAQSGPRHRERAHEGQETHEQSLAAQVAQTGYCIITI